MYKYIERRTINISRNNKINSKYFKYNKEINFLQT